MKRINDDIKSGQFHTIYFLFGQEDYLRKQYKEKLVNALCAGQDSMNYTYMEGKQASVSEMIELAETLPFFADRRVIVCEDTGWFKTADEALIDYLEHVCETTVLVFVEREIDKRSKGYKVINKENALVVEFTEQTEADLARWIGSMVRKEGKNIRERDVALLLEMCGTDMANLKTEMEKLFSYCLEKDVIDTQDIQAVCTRNLTEQVFDMMNAMAEKRQREAMNLYYDLLALKVPPMKILSLISRQFNILLQVKKLRAQGMNNQVIAGHVGLKPFVVQKYMNQSSRFTLEYLRQALEDCIEADESVKTGRMNDVMSVEILLVKFSS